MSKLATSDKLIPDLRAVVHDAEELLKATAAQTGEQIQEARVRTEESLRKVKARLGDIEDEAMKRARAGDAEDYLETNPWQVVGAAAGIGLLIALLMSRR